MIRAAWNRLNARTIGSSAYWSIALQNALTYQDLKVLVDRYARGRILDLGAGRLSWRGDLFAHATQYVSTDLTIESPDLGVVSDATRSYPFADGTFDLVFCCSVLEHCTEPWKAFGEIARVLSPTGHVILSVPFCFYAHGEPHDYYRFTSHAIRYLADRAELDVVELHHQGNLADQVLNVPSVLASTFWSILGLPTLIPPTTRAFLTLSHIFGPLDPRGLFAMNYVAVLRRRRAQPTADPR